jgi:ribosomal protein S12 methylthiotransferase accessory factor
VPGLRLSPSAAVVTTARGVLVRSDLGTLELSGADAARFVAAIVPLLDGTRTREELASALPGATPESVGALLDALVARGAVEVAGDPAPAWHAQARWLTRFTDAPAALERLAAARVVIAGLEPWGACAATELAAAGVGHIAALDDHVVTEGDLLLARGWSRGDLGRPRALALAAGGGAGGLDGLSAALDEGCDLLVVTLPADALGDLERVAREAHRRAIPSLHACLEGASAVLGPAVTPGVTACWACTRLRMLAHAADPAAAHGLRAALLRDGGAPREHSHLAPAAGLLGHLVALEAVKLLTGYAPSQVAGRQLVQSLVTLETTLHGIVRMPWCEVCGGAAAGGSPPPDGPDLATAESPEDLMRILEGWVDPRTGPIAWLAVDERDARGPELPVTATAILAPFTDGRAPGGAELASGKGLEATDALRTAAGEAIERYSAARVRHADLRRAALDELDGDVLDPRDLGLYADHQYERDGFPFDRFDPAAPLHWATARWVDTGAEVWVAALPTYYAFDAPRGERFCQVTSSGLAAGRDGSAAALRAVLELLERDAFMVSWLARLPARRVLPDASLRDGMREALRQLERRGAAIELWLLRGATSLPTIACLGRGDGERWPGLTVALACDPDPRAAAARAILEQGHVGPYLARLAAERAPVVPERPEAVTNLVEHALYYVPPERATAAAFLDDGRDPVTLGDLPTPDGDPWETCRGALARAKMRVAVADVTAPDVATGPFRVARAHGVHAQAIHFGHGLERLASRRLADALAGPVNPEPHPVA